VSTPKELLVKLKNRLKREKELLILTVKDTSYSEELLNVVEEKRKLLSKLASFNKEDFEGLEDLLVEVKQLSDINLNLAATNAQFVEEIFSAIFEEPQKYDQSGTVKQSQKGLFNKKI